MAANATDTHRLCVLRGAAGRRGRDDPNVGTQSVNNPPDACTNHRRENGTWVADIDDASTAGDNSQLPDETWTVAELTEETAAVLSEQADRILTSVVGEVADVDRYDFGPFFDRRGNLAVATGASKMTNSPNTSPAYQSRPKRRLHTPRMYYLWVRSFGV